MIYQFDEIELKKLLVEVSIEAQSQVYERLFPIPKMTQREVYALFQMHGLRPSQADKLMNANVLKGTRSNVHKNSKIVYDKSEVMMAINSIKLSRQKKKN